MSRTKLYGWIFGFVIVLAVLAGGESHAYTFGVHEGHNELVMLSSAPEDTYRLGGYAPASHGHNNRICTPEPHGRRHEDTCRPGSYTPAHGYHDATLSPAHHDHEDQTNLTESHGHSRNLNVILSKPEGIRIIENMEQNRVRSHSQAQTASFGTRTRINQEGSAQTIHQTRHTEIHQTISQRK